MRGRVYVRGSIISIHALLAESDWSRRVPGGRRRHFYPRSPCGERLFEYIQAGTGILFLSTLSLRRATFCAKCRCWVLSNISIHALLAESDIHAQNLCICVIHFYPRSPCGERLHTWQKVNPNPKIFLSTLSLRRATVEFKLYFINQEFLSTLSLRRATQRNKFRQSRNSHFYPRSPCGERPAEHHANSQQEKFLSTLSLRRATGQKFSWMAMAAQFLSTLSLRRATDCKRKVIAAINISIHALLAESDAGA